MGPVFEQTQESLAGRCVVASGSDATVTWRPFLAAGCVAALVLLCIAGGIMWHHSGVMNRQREAWEADASSPERVLQAEVQRSASLVPEARQVVREFFRAQTVEEKCELVRGGRAMLTAMRTWYDRNPDEPEGFQPGNRIEFGSHAGREFIFVHGQTGDGMPVETVVEAGPEGLRLDWRFLTGAGDLLWADWLAMAPQRAVTMRAEAVLDDYFAPPFDDQREWFCLRLTGPGPAASVWAYVPRASDEGMTLWRQLNERRRPVRMAATFSFPAELTPGHRHAPQVRLRAIASQGWLDHSPEASAALSSTANKHHELTNR